MQELGVSYPVLIDPRPVTFIRIEDPDAEDPDAGAGGLGIPLGRFDFQVQFCWQPKSPTQRRDAREAAANAQQDGQSQE